MTNQKSLLKQLTAAFFATALLFAQPSLAATDTATQSPSPGSEQSAQAEESTAETTEVTAHETEQVDPGLLGTLGINWKLFIAQLINFGIILFVLWKWVFKPVSKGLEDRTAKIEKSLKDADSLEKAKKEFEDWKAGAMSVARAVAAQIISDAKTEANLVKKQILEETKAEQEKAIAQTRATIEQEKRQAIADIKTEAADLVVAATQKILGDKLDSSKDRELIKKALKEI